MLFRSIYWSNYFDNTKFLPRHISILSSFLEFRNRRDAFENILRMMYNNQSALLVLDKKFIKNVITMFFSYRSDLSKCFLKFINNKRHNIICIENDRISKNVNILYTRLFRPPVINKTIIDLTLDDIQVQVPIQAQVLIQVPVPVPDSTPLPIQVPGPVPDSTPLPIQVQVQAQTPVPGPVPDSTPLPIQVQVQTPVPGPVPDSIPLPTQVQCQDPIQDFAITPLDIDRSIERIIRKRSMIDLICVRVCKLLRESDGNDKDDEYKRMKLQHRISNE